jgi:hypothetical protein
MDLPLLLAGPVLRRVEPGLVSVWVALSEHTDVRLQVWEGLVKAESGTPPFAESPAQPMVRIGAKLWVGTVTLELPVTTGKSFQPDSLYSYDLEITRFETDGVETLLTLGFLADRVEDGFGRLALGFEKNMLPSFAPPPSKLEELNILYGSCRRPLHRDPDALAMVDDLIFGHDVYKDPHARPHQLFLGGDQIYADDVSELHMLTVMEAAVDLIGSTGDPVLPDPLERLPVDEALLREDETKAVDPTPEKGYRKEERSATDANPWIPADRRHWPEGRRLRTTLVDAQLTSTDGASHLLSLGEFAATYLSVWSQALWGEEVIGARWAPDATKPLQTQTLRWDQVLPPYDEHVDAEDEDPAEGAIVMPPVMFPERIAGHFYVAPKEEPEEQTDEDKRKAARKRQKGLRQSFLVHAEFRKNLPRVQRALANVSTYMILDDHDVTDDYFLNPIWRRRVLGSRLGRAMLGNAMTAYALFQDWGNDPVAYRTPGPKAQLLQHAQRLFPDATTVGPDETAFEALQDLFGHFADGGIVPIPGGRTESREAPLKWHFQVDGPKHRVIALDNRTRRQFASENGPPGNVSPTAMVDQIPQPPLPAGREILIVIAPLQVIGPPVLDELVAPLSYRIFDMVQASKEHSEFSSEDAGSRGMLGTDPDAIEAWSFDIETFEHLLSRLEPYGQVVLLSGDVHYSSGTQMSYWKGDATQPARIAQFTSSGFKNVMPPFITLVDRSLGLAQQLIRLGLGTERVGWDQPADDLLTFPPGIGLDDLTPTMRSRLRNTPVAVPSWGWPDLNDPAHPESRDETLSTRIRRTPDWRWRVKPLVDLRDNLQRPAGIQTQELDADVEDLLADPTTVFAGYQKVAARHMHSLNKLRNARQILFRANVGRLRFQPKAEGRLDAIHEVYTTFADPDAPAPTPVEPEPFLVQVAHLGPAVEEPPELRRRTLQPPVAVED